MVDIHITHDDLKDPAIDDILNLQKSLQQRQGEFLEDIPTPWYYNPVFYYSAAGLLGALAAWGLIEPYFSDSMDDRVPFLSDYILFGLTAGLLGMALGIVHGVTNRNLSKTFLCGTIGIGVGLGASLITTFLAEMLFNVFVSIAAGITGPSAMRPRPGEFPFKGMAFFILMCGRGIAWSVVSSGAGLGLGMALKSKKLLLNGLVGGLVGGMLGGLLFDPISRFVTAGSGEAAVSRGVGIGSIGLLVGLFTGLFENISKEAWLLMLKGPLTGKQFNIFKSPMVIGSSPKADVYLFKDPDIEPKHATVTKTATKYTLKDEGSAAGVYVNGRRVEAYLLQNGDTITVGSVVLRYVEKSATG
jgi:hypothetical protein